MSVIPRAIQDKYVDAEVRNPTHRVLLRLSHVHIHLRSKKVTFGGGHELLWAEVGTASS